MAPAVLEHPGARPIRSPSEELVEVQVTSLLTNFSVDGEYLSQTL
jgi:hypothetical protein